MQIALEAALESVLPPIVEKVLARLYTGFPARAPITSVDEIGPPRYKLNFMIGLATKVFTMKPICDRNGRPLQVCMTATHQEGPDPRILSAKIRVVVLHGDFNRHNQERWTPEEFSNSIVCPRDRVATVLAGDPELSMKNGVADLCGFNFRDNSKFTRSGKFRLGVMVIDNLGQRVQEGITEPFIVKDRRGAGTEKHDIPVLSDEVWRLYKISKNGASHIALRGSGILCVKDLLRLYHKDEQALREILIRAKESVQTTIIEHAKKCCPGTELYSFFIEDKGVILFFNSVCQIVGVKFGDTYTSFDDLEKPNKDRVVNWSKDAYKNMTYDQHDYEMYNGKPRPINQEVHGRSSMEHACTDPVRGHSAEAYGKVCTHDQQVTSGSHSKQQDSERLEYVGDEEEQEEQDEVEQEAVAALQDQVQDDSEQEVAALVEEATSLQAANATVASSAAHMGTWYARVEQENAVLRAHAAELSERLKNVNEVLRIVEEFGGVATENQEDELPSDDPWHLLCLAADVNARTLM